jgi:succinyl-diaminopimelate desuccinylase
MDSRLEEVISVLQDLVRIKSRYFEEDEIAEYIRGWLERNGIPALTMPFHDKEVSGIKGTNVVAVIDGGRPGPVVNLNGHMDTVLLCDGWTHEPYGGVIEDGKLYGVGALDMKSGCAAIMVALKHFIADHDGFCGKIVVSFVADEEGPFGLGTDAILNAGIMDGADVSIVTEPSSGFTGTDFPCVCLGARGGYSVFLEFKGKSAHAAAPEFGVNAAVEASKVIARIDELASGFKHDEALGEGRVCAIEFHADGGSCSVPDHAEVRLFRHIVRGESKASIRKELEELIVSSGVRCEWNIRFRQAPSEEVDGFMPYVSDKDDPYVKRFYESVMSVTGKEPLTEYFPSIGDYNYIGTRLDAPCIVFGAAGSNFHGADEYATVESLTGVTGVIYDYLCKLLTA